MILAELRDYLATYGRVSVADLANRFDADAEALRGMLAVLERKGRVRKLPAGSLCTRVCSGCDQGAPELYEWLD